MKTIDTYPTTYMGPEGNEHTPIYIAQAQFPCLVPGHGRHLVTVPRDGLANWNRGSFIQDADALGCLDAGKRELLMTGYCDEVFEAMEEDEG